MFALNRFALIPTRNRHQELIDVVHDIWRQVDRVYIIDNGSEPPVYFVKWPDESRIVIIRDSEQPPNLSRLWNLGLDQIAMVADSEHKVAVLNDDARVPAGWFDAVAEAMDSTGAAAGCSSPWDGRLTQEILKTQPDTDIMNRMFGPAFIVRGESMLRADERLKWWWNDTDLDWKARSVGGMVVIPTHAVTNLYPNASTVGVNAEQAGRDRETFREAWGWNPW
ncbi:MAG: glycosyltransferase [Planctomycetaceae bacterium]|nr:MAG: glycosyltransferase [Planctomycetaceae bacterium]